MVHIMVLYHLDLDWMDLFHVYLHLQVFFFFFLMELLLNNSQVSGY